jgi:hypothetical protein
MQVKKILKSIGEAMTSPKFLSAIRLGIAAVQLAQAVENWRKAQEDNA